jgi:hypothetical protein
MSLFSTSGISCEEHRSERQLLHAFVESRKRHTITHQDRQLLRPGARQYLGSVNRFARVRWGQAVCREFEEFFGLDDHHPFPNQPLFFVTLTHVACCTSHDAAFVDIPRFKNQLRKGLVGLSFVGMIEPGLYVNVAPGAKLSIKRVVSWHLHAVCWGENRSQMRERFRRLNQDGVYRSLLDSQLGAHQKQIPTKFLANGKRGFLADKLRYMVKSPQKAYRIYRTEQVTSDGEIRGCVRQRKSDLRAGDRITLFHLLKGLYLDQLAMAGGDGAAMLRRIKRAAVRPGPFGY